MEFFLDGVKETSDQAVHAARRIIALLDADRKKIERVHQYAQTHPILSIASTAEKIGSTYPTVAGGVDHMQRLGIMREITGKRRRRLFAYGGYLEILNEGTEPLR